MDRKERINKFFEELLNSYGPQNWWPADSKLECIIGAILTQNTSWKNVEKALDNLKTESLLSVEMLTRLTTEQLAQLIKPSGYYNQKARKIKNFVQFLNIHCSGSLDELFDQDLYSLRTNLLSIKGIGLETADSIILYAAEKPVFVVDTYTHRILYRHNLITEDNDYHEIQEIFTDTLPENTSIYNEYHALIVKVAKAHCWKKNPLCNGCPLEYDPHTV